MLEHPQITRANLTGYPTMQERNKPYYHTINACQVCDSYEAVVKVGKSKLCSECALEEGVTLL